MASFATFHNLLLYIIYTRSRVKLASCDDIIFNCYTQKRTNQTLNFALIYNENGIDGLIRSLN